MAPEGKQGKAVSDRRKRRLQWWKERKKGQGKEKTKAQGEGDVPIQLLSKGKASPMVSSQGFKTLLKPAVLNLSKEPKNEGNTEDNKTDEAKKQTVLTDPSEELMEQVTANMEEFALKSSKKKTKKPKQPADSQKQTKPVETTMDESEDTLVTSKSGSNVGKTGKSWKNFLVLFMGNLPYDVTEAEVREHFIRTGGVKDVRLLTDKKTGKRRGCGYIEFFDEKSYKFGQRLHKSTLKGRVINVEVTVPGQKVFRSKILQKMKDRKKKAGKSKGVQKGGQKAGRKGGKINKPNKYKRR